MAHPTRRMQQERNENRAKALRLQEQKQILLAKQVRNKKIENYLNLVWAVALVVIFWQLIEHKENTAFAELTEEVKAHNKTMKQLESCKYELHNFKN